MVCPDCRRQVDDSLETCSCGFDLKTFKAQYAKIYQRKLAALNNRSTGQEVAMQQQASPMVPGRPRCPFCGSYDLKKITATDKVVNIALFGLYGNKRRYQWHCNTCKTDF